MAKKRSTSYQEFAAAILTRPNGLRKQIQLGDTTLEVSFYPGRYPSLRIINTAGRVSTDVSIQMTSQEMMEFAKTLKLVALAATPPPVEAKGPIHRKQV